MTITFRPEESAPDAWTIDIVEHNLDGSTSYETLARFRTHEEAQRRFNDYVLPTGAYHATIRPEWRQQDTTWTVSNATYVSVLAVLGIRANGAGSVDARDLIVRTQRVLDLGGLTRFYEDAFLVLQGIAHEAYESGREVVWG